MAETPFERGLAGLSRSAAVARVRAVVLSWLFILALILLLGGVLRFHGLDWDQPAGASAPLQMHPDERFLSMVADRLDWPGSIGGYFDTAHSKLNPYNDPETHSYVYGTFPLFLAKGVSTIAGGDTYDTTVVWGRRITALFDTGTILLVFLAGASLFGKKAGLTGALLYALAVLPTQLAHFWTVDPFLTFFGAGTLLLSIRFVLARRERELWLIAAGAGVCLGLGAASKVNALLFVPMLPMAALIRIGLRDMPRLGLRFGDERRLRTNWLTDLAIVSFAIAVGLIVFRLAQPYAFSGPNFWDMQINPAWKADLQRELDFQNGDADYPPFVQFAGRSPFLTPLRNMVLFGLGPALGIAAWASLIAAGVLIFKRRDLRFVLPLTLALVIFGYHGGRFVAFMRYFEPMYPALCLLAGWGVVALWRGAARAHLPEWHQPRLIALYERARSLVTPRNTRIAAGAALAVLIGTTAWWALAFQGIYDRPNPRITASQWIFAHAPEGSAITSELWDDSIPYPLPHSDFNAYRNITLEPYAPDSLEKVQQLVYGRPQDEGKGGLVNADYVAIASNRVRESVKRLEREYPATIRYYELLDSGALGFKLVAKFDSHPGFLGLSLNDSSAEESFTVYDHPEVRIYQKQADFDPARAVQLLDEAHPERAVNLLPRQGRTNGLQFTAVDLNVQLNGGTFTQVFDAHGWASSAPWLWWLVWLELAAFAALPWVTWLFRSLPDRGYGLSKVLGLCAVVLPTWVLVAWGPSRFSGTLAWGVFAAAVAAGLALGFVRRHPLLREARRHWRSWAAMEAAFLFAFAMFLLLRYFNPDLWYHPQGGEKPMEIAYLTAVTRSTKLPPYDPWFAGGTMNYYYMGWFFLAVPIRALRLLPEVAFNLGVPTFAALGTATAFSTVHNLVALSAGARSRLTSGARRRWQAPAIVTGVLAAFLLLGIANLDGLQQTVERFQAVNHWSLFEGVPVFGGVVGVLGGLWRWLFDGAQLPPFDWWRSSRVHIGTFDITEFPYFSLLFADLHPHLMDVPFFGLVIALAVGYCLTVRDGLRGRAWLLAGLIGVAVGLIRTIHTWDFPSAALIGFGALAVGQVWAKGRWQDRWWRYAGHTALAAVLLAVVFQPYTAHFETFDAGLVRAPQTTKTNQYFVQFGIFVTLAFIFLAVRYREELRARGFDHGRNPILATTNGPLELMALAVFVAGLAAFTWIFGLTTIALAILFEVYLGNLLWLEWQNGRRSLPRALATLMLMLGFAISAGVDVVTLRGDIVRMNTVFKFSLQAWQLFALGSAFAAWYSARALWQLDRWPIRPRAGRALAAVPATAFVAVIFLGSSIYLVSGTRARQEARFNDAGPTLNGFDFFQGAVFVEDKGTPDPNDNVTIHLADDLPLIEWLRNNVHGSPVIAEAVGPLYHWTGRMSEYTGLPAVIGWDWHQVQQRTDYQSLIEQRRSDTSRFYTTPSTDFAVQYLRKYNVSYVVVGTEERAFGTDVGLAKFGSMPELKKLFTSGDYAIYQVGQLPPP